MNLNYNPWKIKFSSSSSSSLSLSLCLSQAVYICLCPLCHSHSLCLSPSVPFPLSCLFTLCPPQRHFLFFKDFSSSSRTVFFFWNLYLCLQATVQDSLFLCLFLLRFPAVFSLLGVNYGGVGGGKNLCSLVLCVFDVFLASLRKVHA